MISVANMFDSYKVLRLHGISLIMVGVFLVIGALLGYYADWGDLKFLGENPLAFFGLMQAYFLMAIIGIALTLITEHLKLRKWHLIAFIAHIPALTMTIVFWDLFIEMDKAYMLYSGLFLHLLIMGIELFAFFVNRKKEPHLI